MMDCAGGGLGRIFSCVLVLGFLLASARAQEAGEARDLPAVQELDARIAEIEADETLNADLKASLLTEYRAARQEVNRIAEIKESASQFKRDAETAAARAEEIQRETAVVERELTRHREHPDSFEFWEKSAEELEAARSARVAELAVLEQDLQEIEANRKQRTARRAEIEQQQADAAERRAELQRQLDAPAAEAIAPELNEARQLVARLRLEAFRQAQTANGFELAKYGAEESVGLLEKQQELLQKKMERQEALIARITNRIREMGQAEAKSLEKQAAAQMEAFKESPLKAVAAQSAAYANEFQRYLTKIEGVEREEKQTRERLEQQQAQLAEIQEKEEQVGLTRGIGLMLREQRADLPNLGERERQIANREVTIEDALQQSWDYARERENLPSAEELVRRLEQAASEQAEKRVRFSDEEREELIRDAGRLLETREQLLIDLEQRSKDYFEALTALDSVDRQFVQNTREYLQYINERILWTRSAKLLTFSTVQTQTESWRWLFSATNWWSVLNELADDAIMRPFGFWPALIVVLALAIFRTGFRRRIQSLGKQASKRGFTDYQPTARTAALTMMSAAVVPLALAFLSWRLMDHTGGDSFRLAVAGALAACAVVLFPLELLSESCRHSGLAEAHFNWPPRAVSHLRRGIWWLRTLGLPITFLTVMLHSHDPREGSTAPERLLFLAGMVLIAATLYWLLSGNGSLTKSLKIEYPHGYFSRYQTLWLIFGVGIPLGLGGLSIAGFHYSAIQVSSQLMWTIWLAVILVLARSLAMRWIVLSRRRILLEQAEQRRAAAAEEESQEAGNAMVPPVIEETDVSKNTAQTRRFLDILVWGVALAGLWFVWNSTFPAIRALDTPIRTLWTDENAFTTIEEPGDAETPAHPAAASDADPIEESSELADVSDPIAGLTWLALGGALLIALFTFLASRDLPGLMEMSVLNRLPMDNASRYAATRLTSYAIVIVGVLLAANTIGLKWENVQWLAAALTVGLGFGLQEIFANFVSGLILLFERPIRVGDIVTLDGVTGVVSRIRMRATMITNWERQEFIVPNKDLITGRLLNWTLSTSTTRMTLKVALTQGSDTEQARQLLLRASTENPFVLDDPGPTATFDGFDDGRLHLTLRCYLDGMDQWFDVTHDLHTRIVETFGEAGLDVAFPSRDLHLRSVPPERVRPVEGEIFTPSPVGGP